MVSRDKLHLIIIIIYLVCGFTILYNTNKYTKNLNIFLRFIISLILLILFLYFLFFTIML